MKWMYGSDAGCFCGVWSGKREEGEEQKYMETLYTFCPICCEPKTAFFFNFILFFVFLPFPGSLPRHMEVPRLGVELELQLLTYTTATATQDPSRVCTLTAAHGNARSLTHWARPRPCNLMVPSWINHCATTGTPALLLKWRQIFKWKSLNKE